MVEDNVFGANKYEYILHKASFHHQTTQAYIINLMHRGSVLSKFSISELRN